VKNAKLGSSINWEDEKFSYIAVQKKAITEQPEQSLAKLLRPPLRRGSHVILDLCTSTGAFQRMTIGKRSVESDYYRHARKIHWGDTLPYPPTQRTRASEEGDEQLEEEEQAEK
jgi:ribosomal protein RSM22 (predicted rRNA methylase)